MTKDDQNSFSEPLPDNGATDRAKYNREEASLQREIRDREGGTFAMGNGYMTRWTSGARRSESAIASGKRHPMRLILDDDIGETDFDSAVDTLKNVTTNVFVFLHTESSEMAERAGRAVRRTFQKAADNFGEQLDFDQDIIPGTDAQISQEPGASYPENGALSGLTINSAFYSAASGISNPVTISQSSEATNEPDLPDPSFK